MINKKKIYSQSIFFYSILFIFGFFISITVKYGDDVDTHGLILSYLNIIEKGIYSPSRFYGSPLAEIIIGFFSYNLGGLFTSFICYLLFIISAISIFNFCYSKKNEQNYRNIYLLLAITNPILLFDNSNPSDFILALFFFSIGILAFKSKFNYLSSIFLAFSIACRANFAAFVYAILLYDFFFNKKKNSISTIFIIINTTIIGGLFYLPIFIQYKFGFEFIKNAGGPSFEIYQLLPRFIYKIYQTLGIYNSFLFLALFFFIKKEIIREILLKFKKELLIIFVNLFIFFFIPTKTAIITLAVLFFYIIILKFLKKKLITLMILLNLLYWIVGYKIFDINYKNQNQCEAIQATKVEFSIKLEKGFYLTKKEKIKIKMNCDSIFFKNKKNYRDGKKLSTDNTFRH
jgi:hypothetical protein